MGIKEEDLPKLFKLFGFLESSKSLNTKGIGLGLHISKRITRMFNGDITCSSVYGKGSNFIFLVALEPELLETDIELSKRIMNPVKKKYQKMKIQKRVADPCEQLETELS